MLNQKEQIASTITELYNDSKFDHLKMIKGAAKSVFRSMKPTDFSDAYLSITREQGEYLSQLVKKNNFKNIVEFGTSFGISTLFLAQGVLETKGYIITTELLESKAKTALKNFKKAGVNELIDLRIGDALETLKNHDESIDLLLLDGWMDLYLPLFQMLEPYFHNNTIIYVDNSNTRDAQEFLKVISQNKRYNFQSIFDRRVALINIKK